MRAAKSLASRRELGGCLGLGSAPRVNVAGMVRFVRDAGTHIDPSLFSGSSCQLRENACRSYNGVWDCLIREPQRLSKVGVGSWMYGIEALRAGRGGCPTRTIRHQGRVRPLRQAWR